MEIRVPLVREALGCTIVLRHPIHGQRDCRRMDTSRLVVSAELIFVYTRWQPNTYEVHSALGLESTASKLPDGVKDAIERATSSRESCHTQCGIIGSRKNAPNCLDLLKTRTAPESQHGEKRPPSVDIEQQIAASRRHCADELDSVPRSFDRPSQAKTDTELNSTQSMNQRRPQTTDLPQWGVKLGPKDRDAERDAKLLGRAYLRHEETVFAQPTAREQGTHSPEPRFLAEDTHQPQAQGGAHAGVDTIFRHQRTRKHRPGFPGYRRGLGVP